MVWGRNSLNTMVRIMCASRIRISVAVAALISALASIPRAAELPLQLHPGNPHYFVYKGRPTVLITSGEHYGAVLNLAFDYVAYLDELKRNGFNLTRTFTGTYREEGTSGHGRSPLSPGRGPSAFIAPWAWSPSEGGFEGRKFDLDRWNSAYFDRLKAFCRAAEVRGVIVELVIFSRMYDNQRWRSSPMHSDNNQQGESWRSVPFDRFLTSDSRELLARQKAVVRKIVTELRDEPNVYFEIANEPAQRRLQSEYAAATHAWHEAVAAEIVAAESALPPERRHLIAYNTDYAESEGVGPLPGSVAVVNFHYLNRLKPMLAAYELNKPLGYDETRWVAHERYPEYLNTMPPESGRLEAWEFLVGGGAVYSNLNHAYQVDNPAGRRPESAKFKGYLRSLKKFVEGFDFPRMRQDRTLIASGIDSAESHVSAISEPGKQYAVYVHHSGYGIQRRWYKPDERPRRTSLSLALLGGAYEIEWIRPADLQVLGTERIQHAGGVVALKPSPEYVSDVALRIRATRRD